MKPRKLKENLLQNDLAGLVDYVISVEIHEQVLLCQMILQCRRHQQILILHQLESH